MPDELKFSVISRDASGGVNNRVFAADIQDNQAVELQNIDCSTPGQRQVRAGTSIAATGITYGPILALREFMPKVASVNDTPTPELLAVSRGASAGDHRILWKWDGTGTVFTQVGVLSGYTASDEIQIINGIDSNSSAGSLEFVSVIAQDYDGINYYYYDGSGISTCHYGDSSAPAAERSPNALPMTFAFDRGFGGGREGRRSSVMYSDVISWTVTGFQGVTQRFEFGGGRKDQVVALKQFRAGELIVFMSDKIEELVIKGSSAFALADQPNDPYDDWDRVTIDPEIGCGSRASVASMGEDIYFADQHGNIRSLARTIQDNNQGATREPVSASIQGFIDRINPAVIDRIVCQAFDRWVVVGLPLDSATEPDNVFMFDTVRQAWDGPWTNIDPWSMAEATLTEATADADKEPTLYIGSTMTSEGRIIQWPRGTEDPGSTPIVFQETSKRHAANNFVAQISPTRAQVWALGAGTATMEVESNTDGTGWESRGFVSLLGDSPLLPETLPFNLGGSGVVNEKVTLEPVERCYDIQLRFTATLSIAFQSLGYALYGWREKFEWDVTS